MQSTEETLEVMRREMQPLLETAIEGVLIRARSVLEEVEQQRTQGLAEVAEVRAKGSPSWSKSVTKDLPKSTRGEPSCTVKS
jgi:hypothetical protein